MDRFKAPADAVDLCHFIKPRENVVPVFRIPHLYFCLDVNPSADGSAYLEYGNIKVICSVCGPVELKQEGQVVTSFKFAPFSTQIRRDGVRDPEEKRLSQLLLSALEPSLVLSLLSQGQLPSWQIPNHSNRTR
uniref:RNase_PH domain-containing protein n=1 Tax=Mesocestoides corti TaxID=53468 RepID=A0A5K3FKD9_MESCO